MVPLVISSSSFDAGTNDVKSPKGHVAPHFDFHNLRNAMMPLKTQSASHGTSADANCVT